MSFKFKCKHCDQSLEAEDEWLGMELDCPNCSQTITVKKASGPPPLKKKAPPPLKLDEKDEEPVKAPKLPVKTPLLCMTFALASLLLLIMIIPLGKTGGAAGGVLAVFAIIGFLLLAFLSLITGLLSLFKIKRKQARGKAFVIAGMGMSILLILLVSVASIPLLSSAREKGRRISCASNLKQIGLALKIYSLDYNDQFPPYNGAKGLELLRRNNYLTDYNVYTCPSNANAKPGKNNEPLTGENVDYVFRGGLTERDPAETMIAWSKDLNHKGYWNILYLDGHVTGGSDGFYSEELARLISSSDSAFLKRLVAGQITRPGPSREVVLGAVEYRSKNYQEAATHFANAAKEDFPLAQCYLGILYEGGQGTPQSCFKASELYRKAALKGCAEAQCCLGCLYWNGRGVMKDEKSAIEWFKLAAERGHQKAIKILNSIYNSNTNQTRAPGASNDSNSGYVWKSVQESNWGKPGKSNTDWQKSPNRRY